ncbi:dockerin type I domain-containing protein [Neorhodopirellula pilleata]|uniref:dockerin type I domain-containing protein n=1 Tax=Neorhodopirellula pilleata TaxID=2714738 RepID=UPI001E654EEC|nr:dockerin type I domain-containing protein [Neorhodopirellula pilleata]
MFESLEQRRLLATDIFASATGENLRVVRDGSEVVVTGSVAGELLRQDASTIDSLRLIGSGEDDLLTIDYTGGDIGLPIEFNGNGQSAIGGDALELIAGPGSVDRVNHQFTNANDGTIEIINGASTSTITYTGLEPIVDNLNAIDRVFTFNGGSETITLADDGDANNGLNFIDSTLGESVAFVNPTGSLTINAGVGTDIISVSTLDNGYAASLIIDGGDSADDVLMLSNVNLINTPARGLTLSELETISINGGEISGNTADIGGGVLINNSTSAITTAVLDSVLIQNNAATGAVAPTQGGGGIYNAGAALTITGATTISGNTATVGGASGGGIFSSGTLTITGATITDNDANRAGGGIEIAVGSGPTTLTDVILNSNNALAGPGNGGGLHVTGNGNVTFVRGEVNQNTAASEGGGLWNGSGTMSITGTTVENNTASGNAADNGGGGVFNDAGVLNLDSVAIQGNQADGTSGSGGGLFSLAGIITMQNSIVQNNSANRAGGGIEIVAGTATFTDLQLLNNDVDGQGTTATTPNPGNGGGLHVSATATVTVAGGLVQGNLAREEGGGLWNSSTGTMVVDNVIMRNNVARAAGGGIDQGGGGVFNNGGNVTIRNNTVFTGNLANENLGNGGGVMTVGGTVVLENVSLSNHAANRAGGAIENNAGNVTLTAVTLDNNTAEINGGGLHTSGQSVTTINNSNFTNNTALQEGGGIWNGSGLMTINTATITNNTASSTSNAGNDQGGGGVFNDGGRLDINDATITNNDATANRGNGGGVMTVGGVVTIDDSSIQSNAAGRAGGGIENNNGNLTITNETVGGPAVASGNTAAINGGGLHASGAGSVTTINGGLFQNNVAGHEGGGLWNGAGTMTINGTRILNNTANSGDNTNNDQGGGGVFNDGGSLAIDAAVISNNLATANNGNGGGVMTVAGTLTINDTTIASNTTARAGGGIENNAGNVTLTDTDVNSNSAGINGGGLHASGGMSNTVVNAGAFENNTAAEEGGGLWNGPGTMTISGTDITGNTASSSNNAADDQGGGGVFNIGGMLNVTDAAITNNLATANDGNGGGIFSVGGGITITGTFVGSNEAARNGGGLSAVGTTSVTITGGTFRSNVAGEEGGGLWNSGTTMTVTGTNITENVAMGDDPTDPQQGGGGAFNELGVLNLIGVLLTDNTADGVNASGGGAFNHLGELNVSLSTISGNNECGLTYFRPQGSILNNTFAAPSNALAPNIGGNLCPLIGTDAADTIVVRDNEIRINNDRLQYVDDTLGPITILSGDGNDTFNIQSTDIDNVINADGEAGTDTFNISSNAPGLNGNLDAILGDINIIGGDHDPQTDLASTVQARRSPGETSMVDLLNIRGDVVNISDRTSVSNNTYELNATRFQHGGAATNNITFATIEELNIETGQGNDTVTVMDTTASGIVDLDTNDGNDTVNVQTTGLSSLLTVRTENGSDRIGIDDTGDRSILQLMSGAQNDEITIRDRGGNSGIDVKAGAGTDQIIVGGPAPVLFPTPTGLERSVILIDAEDDADEFIVNEVFLETVVELLGGGDNDTFTLNASGSDSEGYLRRLNDDPNQNPSQDSVARTRELLIDGGGNAPATREFSEGLSIDASNRVSEDTVGGQEIGDRILVNAANATDSLDLRYAIDGLGFGVLATTNPVALTMPATQDGRATIGNEVVDSIAVELFEIRTGSGNDILTITSQIPYGIQQSRQAIRFDSDGGSDRLEILGTDADDSITVGPIGDADHEPIEIANVENMRVDGRAGNDEIFNSTSAIAVLDGHEGDDILRGGSSSDLLTGGPGIDLIFGEDGNDVLFSDRNFNSDQDFENNGDVLDGGNQAAGVRPGDICVQLGADFVRNCEVLGDGGAQKDVLTWLRARIVDGNDVSFVGRDPQLEPFDGIPREAIPEFETTERSISDPNAVPVAGDPSGEPLLDVNGDGRITAIDALRIINELNALETGATGSGEPTLFGSSSSRSDVNGDGRVTAIDALMVINEINRSESAAAEPVAGLLSESMWSEDVDDLFEQLSDEADRFRIKS